MEYLGFLASAFKGTYKCEPTYVPQMAFGKLYLGVDGGGSNTRSLLVDSRFNHVGLGKALGCNPHNCGYKTAGNRIDESIANAIDSLDFDDFEIDAIYCGIAGIRTPEEKSRLADSLEDFNWWRGTRLTIDSDLSIAHEAGLGNTPGICLVIGTGAACIGKSESGTIITHSNRLPNGDEPGSGYAIGLDAVTAGLVSSPSKERNQVAEAAKVAHRARSFRQYKSSRNSRSKLQRHRGSRLQNHGRSRLGPWQSGHSLDGWCRFSGHALPRTRSGKASVPEFENRFSIPSDFGRECRRETGVRHDLRTKPSAGHANRDSRQPC